MIPNERVLPALMRRDFALFLRFAYREIGGEGPIMWNFHVDAMIHRMNLIEAGECRRQIITLPPRHLKSVVMTAWVAWRMGNNPALRFICASYGQDLADKHARDCLRVMEAPWYRQAFPALRLTRRSVADFETTLGGFRLSTSVGGVITGRGADCIIIDDPMKADDALSDPSRKAVIEWFDGTLKWRLERQDLGSIILVMQRLHEDDLAGDLLRRGDWDELRLPAIAPADELVEVGPGRHYQRREGHALHPARQSLAVLERLRKENAYIFAAQQNQDPVPIAGNWVSPEWFGTYTDPPTSGLVVASIDSASKTNLTNDYSVIIIARYFQKRFYILDVCRKRMEFGELKAKVVGSCRDHRVERLMIEDAASGQQLIQMLRPPPDGVPFPIACRPDASKEVRFDAQASRIQAGEVVLPQTAPWLAEFVKEVAAFPGGRFDDQADALAQLLRYGIPYEEDLELVGPLLYCNGEWFGDTSLIGKHEDYDGDPWLD
jgi:predicted phage terminase large subunit-like protein